MTPAGGPRGRPLWFLFGVGLSWSIVRGATAWLSSPDAPPLLAPVTAEAVRSGGAPAPAPLRTASGPMPPARAFALLLPTIAAGAAPAFLSVRHDLWPGQATAPRDEPHVGPVLLSAHRAVTADPLPLPGFPVLAGAPREVPGRAQASAWLFVRKGDGFDPDLPQLGGSQLGLRASYRAVPALDLVARLAAPLRGPGAEGALGLEVRVERHLRAVVERRVGLDGQPGGWGLGVIGGVDSVALPADFTLEAYGQAGVIARDRRVAYADIGIRALRPIDMPGNLRVGGGVWAAAQPEGARIDAGPSLALVLPQAPARLILDWRFRLAGRAAPGSGPSLTLAANF